MSKGKENKVGETKQNKTEDQIVTINGNEYRFSDLSEEAKTHYADALVHTKNMETFMKEYNHHSRANGRAVRDLEKQIKADEINPLNNKEE